MQFQPPRGTRDFLPEEMIKRDHIIDAISSVFRKWGFDPVSTPAFEDWSLLAAKGGETIKNEIYYFKDKSDRELGLRFDFTVPLARVVATNPTLPKPFRRYQIGPVWRYDRPGAGRYRELWQADIDVVGAPAGEADALCIAVACDALKSLGSEFFVRLNNRKILDGFLLLIGLEKNIVDVMRTVDKLDKIGEKGVAEELKEKKITADKTRKILDFIKIKNLSDAKRLVEKQPTGAEGVAELENILEYISSFGFIDVVKFDGSLVRGLEYYTGPVFEVNAGLSVSVAGGGRYDNLIESFGGKPTPAVGISLGIDRVALALEEKLKTLPKTVTKIYVASVNEKSVADAIRIAQELISLGVPSEFDVMSRSLSKQLDYVNAKGIPFLLVVGEKEIVARKAKIRDMSSGKESEIALTNLEDVKKIVK